MDAANETRVQGWLRGCSDSSMSHQSSASPTKMSSISSAASSQPSFSRRTGRSLPSLSTAYNDGEGHRCCMHHTCGHCCAVACTLCMQCPAIQPQRCRECRDSGPMWLSLHVVVQCQWLQTCSSEARSATNVFAFFATARNRGICGCAGSLLLPNTKDSCGLDTSTSSTSENITSTCIRVHVTVPGAHAFGIHCYGPPWGPFTPCGAYHRGES